MSFLSKFEKYDHPLFGYVRLPAITITEEERKAAGAPVGCTNNEFLRILTRKGFHSKISAEKKAEYGARAKRELEMFEKLSFVDYVLLVWKTVNYCDRNNIARDYGRGSAAGSLVFFLLDITAIDPIRYDLFFERFVSEARAKKKDIDGVTYVDGSLAPDVDIDIEQMKRMDVVDYLKQQYPGRVCKISTLGTLSGKALIKEAGKIAGEYEEEAMKPISDMIPKRFGIVKDIEEAYDEVPKFKQWCDANRLVYDVALRLRDLIKSKGSHASGFVVSYDPIADFLPLELVNKPKGQDGKEPASALTMEYVAQLTIKLDLLGVRCCSVVAKVLAMTGEKIANINIDDDPIIYDNLQNLITPQGIFQLEAPTNYQVSQKVKPKNLSELSDVVAIARPGALSFLDDYVTRKTSSVHPKFDPILGSTRFVCLYQEQMMQLSSAIGFTLDEAEQLRRIVGKKKREEIAAWEKKVWAKIKENNLPEELGTLLWKILDDSASYSFNKSHAISYAALAALTAYLKFKYPLQFYLALLQESQNEPKPLEEVAKIESELRYFNIKLLPPHLTKSGMDFKIEGKDIRYGLSGIKGVSEKTISKLKEFQSPYQNKFQIFQGANDAGISILVQSALIQSGCLDGIDTQSSRPKLTLEAQSWNALTEKQRIKVMRFGEQTDYNLFKALRLMKETKDEKGKPLLTEKNWETFLKKYAPYKAIYELNSKNLQLANFFYERTLLGYSYSSRLIDVFNFNDELWTIEDMQAAQNEDRVKFVAVVSEKVYEGTSQKESKTRYARWNLSDETGHITGLLFNNFSKKEKRILDRIQEIKDKHDGKLPTKGCIVYCEGKKMGDAVFLDKIADQSVKIYTKFRDIQRDKEKEVDSSTNES